MCIFMVSLPASACGRRSTLPADNSLKKDALKEETLKEDALKEETLKVETLKGDAPKEETLEKAASKEETLKENKPAAEQTDAGTGSRDHDENPDSQFRDESLLAETVQGDNTADTQEGYERIGGTWKVGGIYSRNRLIDIHDNDTLASMYNTTMITFNEDGSFIYLKTFNDRGTWSKKSSAGQNTFFLKTESSYTYDLQNGALVEKESETAAKKQYIASMLDENTFILNEYDPVTGKAKAGDHPYLFVKQGTISQYIANNKTPVKSKTGSQAGSSSNKNTGPTARTGKTDMAGASSGEKNALKKALQYLDYTAFSYSGLIEQLEFEGFTHSEAAYGADHCGADWNEQAAKKAKQYLDYSPFSRSELIDQLVFEGFTRQQAEYGVSKVY